MKKVFKILSALTLSAMIVVGFSACSNDNTPESKRQKEKKEESTDEAHKIILKFAPGHFHPGAAFHQSSFPDGVTHIKSETVFSYERKEDIWVLTKDSPKAMFIESTEAGSKALNPYGLWISYFDKDGKEITGRFSENGMINQYQHFFTVLNVTDLEDKQTAEEKTQTTDLFDYVYMDSDPWDKQIKQGAKRVGSKLIKEDKGGGNPVLEPLNPLGLKGFFNFTSPLVKFTLKIDLLHMPEGKMDNGSPRMFYLPKTNTKKVVTLTLPIVVFMSREELEKFHLESDPNELDVETYEKLSAEGKALVDHIAKIFGFTREQAFKEMYTRLNEYAKDSSTLYF
ncbi:hypothetical protein [Porphyromonas sp.]|uniref:hypothetical protein n=1 Tax=Porphyromonas sp. TaxID=1924944 RepID=UPI0026DD4769|nr:hypothetical protein [Porphyromonas sp.]MDO4695741.1 hypothetical protein [Porphyromonas sp.]MDO4771774.1 hypothetical protein [Porphyromonas sp.]